MPPLEPMTTPEIALRSLLATINTTQDVLADISKEARRNLPAKDRDAFIKLHIETDALLIVAEAIVLATVKGTTSSIAKRGWRWQDIVVEALLCVSPEFTKNELRAVLEAHGYAPKRSTLGLTLSILVDDGVLSVVKEARGASPAIYRRKRLETEVLASLNAGQVVPS